MICLTKICFTGLFIGWQAIQICCVNQVLPANRNSILEDKGKNLMIDENDNSQDKKITDIKFEATANVSDEKLTVTYKITNQSKTDIYLLDVLPLYDPETRQPHVDLNNSVLIWQEPDTVRLIRGLPPYPEEKDMSAFITPQAKKIAANESLKREIELPLPLVESNPYYSPLEPEKYEPVKVNKLKLYVDIIRSDVEGFEAKSVAFGEDLFHIRSKYLIAQVKTFYKEFSIMEIELLSYPGTFTRSIKK